MSQVQVSIKDRLLNALTPKPVDILDRIINMYKKNIAEIDNTKPEVDQNTQYDIYREYFARVCCMAMNSTPSLPADTYTTADNLETFNTQTIPLYKAYIGSTVDSHYRAITQHNLLQLLEDFEIFETQQEYINKTNINEKLSHVRTLKQLYGDKDKDWIKNGYPLSSYTNYLMCYTHGDLDVFRFIPDLKTAIDKKKKEAADKEAADKAAADKAAADKEAADKAAADKAEADKAAADKAEADKAAADKAEADKAAADKAAADKEAADKAAADKAEADKAAADKAEADKAAADKAEADKAAADKAEADKAAADKAEADKAAADKAEADKAEADKAEADKAAADKAEADKAAASPVQTPCPSNQEYRESRPGKGDFACRPKLKGLITRSEGPVYRGVSQAGLSGTSTGVGSSVRTLSQGHQGKVLQTKKGGTKRKSRR
jgi:hypothetical protein